MREADLPFRSCPINPDQLTTYSALALLGNDLCPIGGITFRSPCLRPYEEVNATIESCLRTWGTRLNQLALAQTTVF